jgi:hypothetical protein
MAILQRCCAALRWDDRACDAFLGILAGAPALVHHLGRSAPLYRDSLRADNGGALIPLLQFAQAKKVRAVAQNE